MADNQFRFSFDLSEEDCRQVLEWLSGKMETLETTRQPSYQASLIQGEIRGALRLMLMLKIIDKPAYQSLRKLTDPMNMAEESFGQSLSQYLISGNQQTKRELSAPAE